MSSIIHPLINLTKRSYHSSIFNTIITFIDKMIRTLSTNSYFYYISTLKVSVKFYQHIESKLKFIFNLGVVSESSTLLESVHIYPIEPLSALAEIYKERIRSFNNQTGGFFHR